MRNGMTGAASRALQHARHAIRDFKTGTHGGVAVMTAILSPVLIGGMGLGAETGYWYLSQRTVQHAADVGAHAAAMRKVSGDLASEYEATTTYVVGNAGPDLTRTTVTVNTPPTTGSFTSFNDAVEVEVVETIPRMFSAIYTNTPVTITGRSVAHGDSGGAGCVIALSPTEPGAITVGGSANLTLTACDIVSNSADIAFDMNGTGSSVHARCVQAVGTINSNASLTVDCERLRENANPIRDPYGSVPEPAVTGTCNASNVGQNNTATTVTPVEPHGSGLPSIRYCNGLSMRGNVTLNPGLYIIEGGDFVLNANTSVTGSGVVFYLADGVELQFNGTADMDVSAPASGDYAGILIFGSRSATTMDHKINGDAGMVMDGAIYTPASHLDFIGNTATSAVSCTQIIGNTVAFSGNGSISITCQNTAGNDAHTGAFVQLVE